LQQYSTHSVVTRWQQYSAHLHTNSTHNTAAQHTFTHTQYTQYSSTAHIYTRTVHTIQQYSTHLHTNRTHKQYTHLYTNSTHIYTQTVHTFTHKQYTHLHTNSTHNTQNGTYIKIKLFRNNLGRAGRALSLPVIPWHLPYN
jgi:hypothetical protein